MEQLIVAFGTRAADLAAWLSNPTTQLLAAPLLGCILICLTPAHKLRLIRQFAVIFSGLSLLTAILMATGLPVWLQAFPAFADYIPFQPAQAMQFSSEHDWFRFVLGDVQAFGVKYFVGVDGLSLPLIIMSTFVCFLAVLWALSRTERIRDFFALTLLLETGLLGVFVAQDFVLFYLFWELMLIPMYFLIAGWGKHRERASKAALKFFIYTIFGSVFMLIAFIGMQVLSTVYSFSIPELSKYYVEDGMGLLPNVRALLFLGLLLGFAVKVPMFPFHTWLPDAHTEAPTEMSVILAAVLLKTGAYAYLRILYPCFPDVAYRFGPLIAFCGLAAIVYGAGVTLVQTDLKRMVAYSSISHMGFVVLGISALNPDATVGAVFQMVAHGVVISALFFMCGAIERIYGTRDLRQLGGMLRGAPSYAFTLAVAAFAGMGLPGLAGFWGEFLVLKGTFFNNPNWMSVQVGAIDGSRFMQIAAVVAVIGVLTAAVYMINMLQRVLPGEMRLAAAGQGSRFMVQGNLRDAVAQTSAATGGDEEEPAPALSSADCTPEPTPLNLEPSSPEPSPLNHQPSPGFFGFKLYEGLALVPLTVSIIALGLYPRPIFDACLIWANYIWAKCYMPF